MKKYTINNLTCANCAVKIEDTLKATAGIRFAAVNFSTRTLALDADTIDDVPRIIDSIEPGATLSEKKTDQKIITKQNIPEFALFGFGLVLYITTNLISDSLTLADQPLKIFLLGIAYLLAGGSVLFHAVKNIFTGKIFDERFLMTISTAGAWGIGAFNEAVAVMLFYRIGIILQNIAVTKSRKSVESILEIHEDRANVVRNGETVVIDAESVEIDETIMIKPGERVPVDAVVTRGESTADTSALTGESAPRYISVHSGILSGFINGNGLIEAIVVRKAADSAAARIISLVEDASDRKSKVENTMTRFARVYTPIVVVSALAVAVIPPIAGFGLFSEWIYRACVLLVISCPCALVVSVPLGYFGGLGGASRKGAIIKGASIIDSLAKITRVVFDKTGTLTTGNLSVVKIIPANGFSVQDLLSFAAHAEAHSTHPAARAVRKAYNEPLNEKNIADYEEIPGRGIRAHVFGKVVLAGNGALVSAEPAEAGVDHAGMTVFVSIDGIFAGAIILKDESKKDAEDAIRILRNDNIETSILSGDTRGNAVYVAESIGVTDVRAGLLPHEKVSALENIMTENKTGLTAFAGDGINDAPVIARADVGFAMGALGSDAAVESADVVISGDEPSRIPVIISHAKRVRRIISQNIAFAIGIKAIFFVLGIAGIATMWGAVFADTGVTVLAVINSARTLKK